MSKVDILKIAKEAQDAKNLNPNIVNGTIGMFLDDNHEFIIHDVIDAYHNLNLNETFKYGPTDGGETFKKNVIDWVFGSKVKDIQKYFDISVIASPGGSGALSLIFNSYGNINDVVLVPDIRWRYDYFINSANKETISFKLFDENNFNINDLKEKIGVYASKQETLLIVINDPCHNPTGYQLSNHEWDELIDILNMYDENQIKLIYDIAYMDFNPEGLIHSREKFIKLTKLKRHVEPLIAFSASKSFAIYGVRLGALIALHQLKEQALFFKNVVIEDALGKWSTAPSVGIGIFNEIIKNKDKYLTSLERFTHILSQRGNIFIEEANEVGLKIYPYKGGFFVLIKHENPIEAFEKLKQNNIYLVPMDEGLRLALCSIPTDEIKGLATRIFHIIK